MLRPVLNCLFLSASGRRESKEDGRAYYPRWNGRLTDFPSSCILHPSSFPPCLPGSVFKASPATTDRPKAACTPSTTCHPRHRGQGLRGGHRTRAAAARARSCTCSAAWTRPSSGRTLRRRPRRCTPLTNARLTTVSPPRPGHRVSVLQPAADDDRARKRQPAAPPGGRAALAHPTQGDGTARPGRHDPARRALRPPTQRRRDAAHGDCPRA